MVNFNIVNIVNFHLFSDIFPADQYFIVYEFIDGGEDLECFEFSHMEEALSVIQQIVLSLSVSELSLKFEHRDLHWGNILIKRSNCQTLHYKLNGDDVYIESCGVFVSIIDFTLSRLTKGMNFEFPTCL